MRNIVILSLVFMLSACGSGQFGASYKSYVDPHMAPGLVALAEDGEPNLIRSNDMDRDVQLYREHNFVVIGESAFNGFQENPNNAVKKAREVGATHVIVSSEYTDTQSYLDYDYQDFYRTYYVNRVRNVNGERVVTREAVTVRDTVSVPYMRHYDNYDQWAVFMVKSNNVPKLGLVMRDLAPEDRSSFGRNTGAYVDVVLSNSPAFLADIVPGDVIVAVNGIKANNRNHAEDLIGDLESQGETIVLTVLKDGKQQDITFNVREGQNG